MSGLEEMIAAQRELEKLPERTAKYAAEALDAAVRRTAAGGSSPDGKAWAPTKDGGRAMKGAAGHIATKALGPVVRMTLSGPDVFHHYGVRGEPRRQVIPDGGGAMPEVVSEALDKASLKAFEELVEGKK